MYISSIVRHSPLQIEAPGFDGAMSISYDPRDSNLAMVRLFKEAPEGGLRPSVTVEISRDRQNVWRPTNRQIEAPKIAEGVDSAVEDPTIFYIGDVRFVAFTNVVKPIGATPYAKDFPEDKHHWHCAELWVCPYPDSGPVGHDAHPMIEFGGLRHQGIPLNNIKEVEVMPQAQTGGEHCCFFEAGGADYPSQIRAGDLDPSSMTITMAGEWLKPGNHHWAHTHSSPGPIVDLGNNYYLMFANGKSWLPEVLRTDSEQAVWNVGGVAFYLYPEDERPEIESAELLIPPEAGSKATYNRQLIRVSGGAIVLVNSDNFMQVELAVHDDQQIFPYLIDIAY